MTGQNSANRAALLAIYLNDHLAAATGGVELARRLDAAHRSDPIHPRLSALAEEIAEDREALIALMRRIGATVDPVKVAFGWLGEKTARLKLNGRLLTRSPLSDLIELEAMWLGVEGKVAGWRTLRAIAERETRLDPTQLDRLLERASRQIETLETLRAETAAQVLTGG